jgi:hypothetical protein
VRTFRDLDELLHHGKLVTRAHWYRILGRYAVGARTVVEDALGIGVLHEEGIPEFDHFSSPALHDGHNLLFLLLSGESSKAMLNLDGPYGLRQIKNTVISIANPSAP